MDVFTSYKRKALIRERVQKKKKRKSTRMNQYRNYAFICVIFIYAKLQLYTLAKLPAKKDIRR